MIPNIGFSLQSQYDRPIKEVIALLKEAGFSAVSPTWSNEADLAHIAGCGLPIQSLHAPPKGISALWKAESCPLLETMLACVDACARFQIPTLVIHGWQGHDYTFREEDLPYDQFDRIVSYAREKEIHIAFENLEGEEYLNVLMRRYPDVGFCWDTGHDRCYPHQLDFLKEFGHRLIMTHLNDNLGRRAPTPASTDDLHYLPGDGSANWQQILLQLKNAARQDTLNFEIKIAPRCPADDLYSRLRLEDFIALAAQRAQEIAKMYSEGF